MRDGDERHVDGHERGSQQHLGHAPADVAEKGHVPPAEDEMERQAGSHKRNEDDAEEDGGAEIIEPATGIEESARVERIVHQEESQEEQRCSQEIPDLDRQFPKDIGKVLHTVTNIKTTIIRHEYSIFVTKTQL